MYLSYDEYLYVKQPGDVLSLNANNVRIDSHVQTSFSFVQCSILRLAAQF